MKADFFADTLPHLVLKGDYIIGKKDADSPRDIYSIHPKITDYFDLSNGLFHGPSLSHGFEAKRSRDLQATSNEIRQRYTEEQIAHICDQLEMFLVKLKQYIDQHNGIFDFIVGDNLVITKDGDFKLIDTNVIIPIANPHDQERYNRIQDDELRLQSIGEEKPFDRDESAWESRVFREVETANEIPKIFLAFEKLIADLRRPRTN